MPRKTRRLKGGALFFKQDQFTPEKIEEIMCNGRRVEDLPSSENPIYVLKWGPPGSGKSSAKVTEFIKSLGQPIENYVDYSTDKLVESYIPFRAATTVAKLEYEKAKALFIARGQWVTIRGMLQKAATKLPALRDEIAEMLRFDSQPKDNKDIFKLFEKILYASLSNSYFTARDKESNTEGTVLYKKMTNFMKKCFTANVNIIYETLGGGYGRGKPQRAENQFGEAILFENHWEPYLGRIKYSDGIPTIDRTSFGDETIPINYRIFVVYPLLDKNEIIRRSYTRAVETFTKSKMEPVEDLDAYRELLLNYAIYIRATLAPYSKSGELSVMQKIVDKAISEEKLEYLGANSGDSYTKYIGKMVTEFRNNSQSEKISFPFFRAISPDYIYSVIKQAFNYSVDYFLKQYILAGRIEQVVYINNRDVYKSKLFLDMDGVFCDFESRFQAILAENGITPQQERELTQFQRWSILMKKDPYSEFTEENNRHFFDTLTPLPGAIRLWVAVNDFLFRSGQKCPIFLTGCPVSPFRKWAEEGKEAWVRSNFLQPGGTIHTISVPEKEEEVNREALHAELAALEKQAGVNDIIMIFCRPEQKQLFNTVEPHPILIDDRTNAGPQWTSIKNMSPMFIHHKFNPIGPGKYNKIYRNMLSESASARSIGTLRRLYGGKRRGHKTRRA
jgi:hypothetical protein